MTTMGPFRSGCTWLGRWERTVESQATRHLRMRLANARLRRGSASPSPERVAGLRGVTIVQILHSGRQEGRLLKPHGP
jgi:hypothetical protein